MKPKANPIAMLPVRGIPKFDMAAVTISPLPLLVPLLAPIGI